MSIHNATAHTGSNPIIIETGKLAKLADGAVTVRCGDTIVLVTAVSATKIKEGQDFFPLSVEYRERAAAVGKLPGGYFKREGRPTEKEVLTARMTDRPLRPLFPKGYLYDTQIIGTVMSADGQIDPDILSINGASAALCVSDIPFAGPVGAVRVGRIQGKFVANPTWEERAFSDLDLVYVGTENDVIMIEGAGNEIPEEEFIKALEFGHIEAKKIIAAQKELAAAVNKAKREMPLFVVRDELMEIAYEVAGSRIEGALYQKSKVARSKAVNALKDEVAVAIKAKFPEASSFEVSQAFEYLQKKAFRIAILDRQARCDGRGFNDIRELSGETGILPRTHGSSLFASGETQAVCLATLAPSDEAQELDGYTGGATTKRFILHYNFPPFSVGETGRVGGMNRREIGHGALAERSIEPVIPDVADFPYAIRISSEVCESNGSTSMASVCGGVLALMDAGVPLKKPVAGISVGLVTEFEGDVLKRYTTLADILGSEDHYGDMDFKLCGTRDGVTGFQLDLKLPGVSQKIFFESVLQARELRMRVLDVMQTILAEPRKELSPFAPRIETLKINPDKIGLIIGPGGKNIKSIVAETGCEINIEDDGSVHIYSNNPDGMHRAKQIIRGMTQDITIGDTYEGTVVTIKEFGAFVEVLPGKDGLVHISELADFRVRRVEDVVKVGDRIAVKCIGVDDRGKVKLSRRAAMKDKDQEAQGGEAGAAAPAAPAEDAAAGDYKPTGDAPAPGNN